MKRRFAGWIPICLAVSLAPLHPGEGEAQDVTSRTPNLSGGWVGTPGTLQLHFDHRFWVLGERVFNSPTFLVAVPITDAVVVGGHYASNSRVSPESTNEWEAFARWSIFGGGSPVEVAVTGGYNVHAGSADGELGVAIPMGGVRFLGAARAFSDAMGSGDAGWFAGGGAVVPIREGLSLAGDIGRLERDGEGETRMWGVGLQLRIPTTPHTLSIRAGNTRTGTLQGTSVGGRTTWGFEFTIPFTIRRYFRGSPGRSGEANTRPRPDTAEDAAVEVTMTDDLRFMPDTVRIQVGQTVAWTNTTPLPHTVTAHPDRVRDPAQVLLPEGAEPFDSGFMFEGDVFRHTFTVPGTYDYVCVPHDMAPMVGTIIVDP
jgi:plastocyanin